jgi:L-asparaginase
MGSSFSPKIVVLGTGGTIAGLTTGASAQGQYRAGQVGIEDILKQALGVDLKPHFELRLEQVCQIDSKDLEVEHWQQLLARLQVAWLDPEVKGLVITHGTDTMEETAFLLSWLLPQDKPVVLTGAMRAFDAEDSDGAHNLQDALRVLAALIEHQMGGVRVVFAGQVHSGSEIQKMHAVSLQAFESAPWELSGEAIDLRADWRPQTQAAPVDVWPFLRPSLASVLAHAHWPRVEVVVSHAGLATGGVLQALVDQRMAWLGTHAAQEHDQELAQEPALGLEGVVIAGTGSGTWSESMREPLLALLSLGVTVVFTTRVPWGREALRGHPLLASPQSPTEWSPHFAPNATRRPQTQLTSAVLSRLPPLKARIALVLHLMASKGLRTAPV